MERPDARAYDQLRPISFIPGIAPHASGSVLVGFGDTRVICSAKIEEGVPRWMKMQNVPGGWITAEYAMLPYSTLDRKARDISRGHLDGRSSEIQRLIGRSLRAVIDLKAIGPRTVWIDCDVLQADGGTRTASITGAAVACSIAFNKLIAEARISRSPMRKLVAAVSCGIYKNEPVLDLAYLEDKHATVDFNYVMTEDLQFVEMQGSGEESTFSEEQLAAMTILAKKGMTELNVLQKKAILSAETPAAGHDLEDLARHFGR